MPTLAVVDSHVHVWDPVRLQYPWLDELPQLRRRYDLTDFRAACGDVEIERIVFVQAGATDECGLDEIAWIAELAADEPRLAGAVAWAPLERGAAVREHVQALASQPLVRGVRRLLQDEADPEFCLRPDFVAGVRLLADFDFTFDLCIRAPQLPAVTELVRSCPEVSFVLDHLGKPPIAAGRLDPWRERLAALAELPNVTCKVSGLATEADHVRWSAADLQPFVTHALECFGTERVMFGGDWPVALLATSYPRWVQTLDDLVAGRDDEAVRRLYRDNAMRVYRLG